MEIPFLTENKKECVIGPLATASRKVCVIIPSNIKISNSLLTSQLLGAGHYFLLLGGECQREGVLGDSVFKALIAQLLGWEAKMSFDK